jgi:hypothetical protein
MANQDDFALYSGPQQPSGHHDETPVWVWVVVGAAVVVIAVLGYWYFRSEPVAPPVETEAAAPPTTEEVAPPPAEPMTLPALGESDTLVRDLVRGISSNPELATWLATPGLVRNAAVVVDNIAEGVTPAKHLSMFAPKQEFQAAGNEDAPFTDPRSFARYNGIADAVASIDAGGAVQAYRNLRPLFDEAYKDLGHPDGNFDVALQKAISLLLATPDAPADVPLESRVESYHFKDAALEDLTGAQKQLLRMGPRNDRLIKDKLREILRTLGFEERR